MVLALFLYFMFFVAEIENDPTDAEQECKCRYRALLLPLFDLERKNNSSRRFSSKDKNAWYWLGYALYSEI
jgi:hypothetical protein